MSIMKKPWNYSKIKKSNITVHLSACYFYWCHWIHLGIVVVEKILILFDLQFRWTGLLTPDRHWYYLHPHRRFLNESWHCEYPLSFLWTCHLTYQVHYTRYRLLFYSSYATLMFCVLHPTRIGVVRSSYLMM